MIVDTSLFTRWVKFSPSILITLLIMPVVAGLLGVILPAFGWLPALGEDTVDLRGFEALFATPGFVKMLALSFSTSFVSTFFAVLLSILILGNYFNSKLLGHIQTLLGPILVIPHAAAAIAIGFLIAPSGLIMRLFSPWLSGAELPPDILLPNDPYGFSIILGLTLKELPFILLMAMAAMQQKEIKQAIEGQYKVALSLGYHPFTSFCKAVLPMLYPFIRLPIYAILAYSSASIEIPLILGPNTPPTLAVAIMQWFNDVDLHLRIQASAGALVQIMLTLCVLFTWWLLEQCVKRVCLSSLINGRRTYADVTWKFLTHCITLVVLFAIVLALIGLVLWSFAGYWSFPKAYPDQLVTQHWQSALQQLPETISDTILVALAATGVALFLALFTLEAEQQRRTQLSSFTSLMIYLPLLVPSIAFLFGIVWVKEIIGINAVFSMVVVGHLLFVMPYVFLSLATSYRKLDLRYAKVAASLGRSPWSVFYSVKLPQLMPPILFSSALGLAISFSQYLPTLLLGGGRINTLTTEAVAIASGASRRISAVYVILQILLPAFGFILAWLIPKLFFRPRY
ncbi:ABC transporter permease [Glaciecola sp. 33A]|jgi:putative thiamine transport system permease protein|uniref:ABC transporter permease n=1 Tax=Glaciecola sp. 33A TaxID=2057807 RepID=UPI000C3255D4|nr:ABC transporter permease subunit [Glaciecola sp. 33A]PKI01964.1 ABC transporter permease [Glaciecola sp. 33A]